MAKSKLTQKDTPRQEDSGTPEFDAVLDEMSKMKYVDFREYAIQLFREFYGYMDEMVDLQKEGNEDCPKVIKKRSEANGEMLDWFVNKILDRIENLELHLFIAHTLLMRVRGKSLKPEGQKELASMLNVHEETAQHFMTIQ